MKDLELQRVVFLKHGPLGGVFNKLVISNFCSETKAFSFSEASHARSTKSIFLRLIMSLLWHLIGPKVLSWETVFAYTHQVVEVLSIEKFNQNPFQKIS